MKAHLAREKHILYGGAVGGGKSAWAVNDALRMALAWEGNRVGVFRWESVNFSKTTFNTLSEWVLSVPGLVKEHNAAENWIDLVNGSRIVYGGLKPSTPVAGDIYSVIKSLELNAMYIDEVTDVPEKVWDFACTRVPRTRCVNRLTGKVEYPPPRMAATCNPSMGWVKTRFVDNQRKNHVFIRSCVRDNVYLPPSYEAAVREAWAGNPEWINQYLEGDWSAAVDFACLFIAPWLIRSRKSDMAPGQPIEFGVDIAAGGSDRTVVVRRRGMVADVLSDERGLPDTMITAQQIASLADRYRPVLIKVDAIGVGKGVYDRLAELGYPVLAMIGGATPDTEGFLNKRAEWYWNLRNLLERGKVRLPDRDDVVNELGDIRFSQSASDRTIKVEGKKEIVKRVGHSPDYADATVYCFAESGGDSVISSLVSTKRYI